MNSPRQIHAVWWHLTDLQLRWIRLNSLLADMSRAEPPQPPQHPLLRSAPPASLFPAPPPVAPALRVEASKPAPELVGTPDWLVAYI